MKSAQIYVFVLFITILLEREKKVQERIKRERRLFILVTKTLLVCDDNELLYGVKIVRRHPPAHPPHTIITTATLNLHFIGGPTVYISFRSFGPVNIPRFLTNNAEVRRGKNFPRQRVQVCKGKKKDFLSGW